MRRVPAAALPVTSRALPLPARACYSVHVHLNRLESAAAPAYVRPVEPRAWAAPVLAPAPAEPADVATVTAPPVLLEEFPPLEPAPRAPAAPAAPKGPVGQHLGLDLHETSSGALTMDLEVDHVLVSPRPLDGDANTRPIDRIVVIGGGPGGLASAIRLAERGLPVTVLEIRETDYERPHHLNLRQSTLDTLQELGVYEQVMARSGFTRREEILHEGEFRAPEATSLARGRFGVNARKLIDSDSVTQVRISDVERALYDRATELGVQVEKGWKARLDPAPEGADAGMYQVTAERVRRTADGGFEPTGETRDLGTPLVLVAEGTNSPTRDALGIGFEAKSEPTYYLGGHVDVNLGPITRKDVQSWNDGFQQKLMATGHMRYPQTWVSVQCRPEVAAAPKEERTRQLCEGASEILNRTVKPEDIAWGAGLVTVVQNRAAERAHAGLNVLLVGDTSRSGSVWASGGINLALSVDPDHVVKLVHEVNTGQRTRSQAMAAYDVKMAWATEAWHAAGEFEESR